MLLLVLQVLQQCVEEPDKGRNPQESWGVGGGTALCAVADTQLKNLYPTCMCACICAWSMYTVVDPYSFLQYNYLNPLGLKVFGYSKPGLFGSRGYSGHNTKCITNGRCPAQIAPHTQSYLTHSAKWSITMANAQLFTSVKQLIAHWLIPKSTQLILKISLVDALKSSGILTSRWSRPVFLVVPTTLGLFLGMKQGLQTC